MSGAPARRYSWPPFEPGNAAAVKHGAYSEREVAPLVTAITAELVAIAPWSAEPAFAPSLAALARAEAQVIKVQAFIDEHGPLDDKGVPRPAMALLSDLERRAARLRAEFGMSPTTWAVLRRAAVTDPDGGTSGVEALRAIGAQILEASASAARDHRGDLEHGAEQRECGDRPDERVQDADDEHGERDGEHDGGVVELHANTPERSSR